MTKNIFTSTDILIPTNTPLEKCDAAQNIRGVALEDSIMTKGSPLTAGSKILEGFTAPFDATVVARLREAGFEITGKTRMIEFGIGGFFDSEGGSENGSGGESGCVSEGGGLSGPVQAVMGGTAFCLSNDLFGRYRREAAENGLCYIHPTYGTVSRYGLVPLASSMDQIGVLCKDAMDGFSLLSVIAGHDSGDGAMFPERAYAYGASKENLTACVPSHILGQADSASQEAVRAFSEKLKAADETLEYFDVHKQVMYALSCAEISGNISRYDGIKFGYRASEFNDLESLYTRTRTEAFGMETKLAAIMGCMVLSAENYAAYYEKAMKLRRLIKASLRFDKYDLYVLPARVKGSAYDNLALYAITALSGLPSVTFSYQGGGVLLVARAKNENALLASVECIV